MRIFYVIFLLVFLASCGSETTTQTPTQTSQTDIAVEQTQVDIDQASNNLPEEDILDPAEEAARIEAETAVNLSQETDQVEAQTEIETSEEIAPESSQESSVETPEVSASTKLIELSTTYNNPKIEVIMDIDIEVSENDIIESISVTSPNYGGMPEFNTKIQEVVGLTLDEAAEYNVSGSSLTTPAFQAALKNS